MHAQLATLLLMDRHVHPAPSDALPVPQEEMVDLFVLNALPPAILVEMEDVSYVIHLAQIVMETLETAQAALQARSLF